jgi:hypothetical protein
VGLGALLGCGIRLLELPDFMVPIVVGIAVTAIFVVILRFLLTGDEAAPSQSRVSPAGNERSEAGRSATPQSDQRQDVRSRLSALARRFGPPYSREADEN